MARFKKSILPREQKATHRGCADEIRRLKYENPEMTTAQIAKRTNCSWENTHQVLQRFLGKHSTDALKSFQDKQADILSAVGMRILDHLSDDKLNKSSALQLVTAYGIIQDKRSLLLGQPTSINYTVLADVVEAIKLQKSTDNKELTLDHGSEAEKQSETTPVTISD